MSEHAKRKAGRALLTRSGYKVGGHLASKADEMEDAHMVKEGVSQHEKNMHKGVKPTRLRLRDGGACDGMAAGGRSDRKPRSMKGKGKKGGTTVNVVVAHPHPKPVPVPVPVNGPGPGIPPQPMPMAAGPGGPPMPPPPDGGPPMGAKKGGRIGLKKGGKAKKFPVPMSGGAGGGEGRLEKAKEYGA